MMRRRAVLSVFVAALAVYLASTSREDTWADARPINEVAEAIVDREELSIRTRWPGSLPLGKDGKVYAVAPLLQSLVQVPGALLRKHIAEAWPEVGGHARLFLVHLGSALMGALAVAFFFGLCRQWALPPGTTLIGLAGVALASTLWVYARHPYSEALQAACFTGFFHRLIAAERRPTWWNGLLLGALAGLLVNAKLSYAVSVVGGAAFLGARLWREPRALLRVLGFAAIAGLPLLGLIGWYNHVRWGGVFSTGYELESGLRESRWVGLWGLLFSPGKSVFLYSPPLVLSALALPRLWRQHRLLLWAILATVGPVVLVTASLLYWHGDFAWGPRYMVFAVPVLWLPGCLLVRDWLAAAARWRRALGAAAVAGVLGVGVIVQGLGSAFHWDHFIRIQREARIRWLGPANVGGSPFANPWGECGPCFEDLHGMQWLPPFQPIEGHLWLLRHVWAEHDWATAEKDAPWRRYTRLQLVIAGSYQRARLDWWYLDWRDTRWRARAQQMLAAFGAAFFLAGAHLGWEAFRARRRARRVGVPANVTTGA